MEHARRSPSGRTVGQVTAELQQHRWSTEGFLRAWEAGGFDDARVEMVDGEVWPVSIGSWHGDTTGRATRSLPNSAYEVTMSSLVLATSVVDPDVWVHRADAQPLRMASRRMAVWDPADVLLVVEVGDETLDADLSTKARLYGAAGFAVYWVVGREGVHEHTGPTPFGYRTVRRYWPGDSLPVPYADALIDVGALISAESPPPAE